MPKSGSDKYAHALELYRTTSLSVEEIAERLGLGLNSEVFRSYLREHEPQLMKKRKK